MTGLTAMAVGAGAFALPILGVVTLVSSKIATGPAGATAQRLFFATLLLATVATFRTMMAGEPEWLSHSLTMAVMILGAVCVPAAGETKHRPIRHTVAGSR